MTKKRYFTIFKKGRYNDNEALFRFENLDGAIEMFKYLMQGKAINLEQIGVPDNSHDPDDDGWIGDVYLHFEKGESEYHLGSEIIEIYTEEEIKQISKQREEWKKSFKKKGK